jgi:CHAT domain-containing protein
LAGFDGPAFEDDFLCAQFDLARWVMPGTAPAAEIPMRNLACVAPNDSGLVAAQIERDYMQSIATRAGMQDVTPADATREQVLGLFGGQTPISLWHFACHGDYRDDDPDQSPLSLSKGTFLRPNDLIGPDVEGRLASDRPFVFLNSCRVGSIGLSLAGLGGWARVLVGNCRVGGLIAPLWEVTDDPASQFAQAFYDYSMQPGCTLGQAMRQARLKVRDADPSDPTWLAYSLYAHPNARLKWSA